MAARLSLLTAARPNASIRAIGKTIGRETEAMTDIMILPKGDRPVETSPLREWAHALATRFRDAVSGALPNAGERSTGNEVVYGLPDCMRDAEVARAEWLEAAAAMHDLEREMEECAGTFPVSRLPLVHAAAWAISLSAVSLAGLIGLAGMQPLIALPAVLVNARGAMVGGRLTRQAFATGEKGGRAGRAASAFAAHGAGLLGAMTIALLSAPMKAWLYSLPFLAAQHLALAIVSWRRALPDARLEWLLEEYEELDRTARRAARDYNGRLEVAGAILDVHMEELRALEQGAPENASAGMSRA